MGMRRVVQARIIFWAVDITFGYSKIAGRNFSWMSQMLLEGGWFRGDDWDRGGVEGRTRERDSLVGGYGQHGSERKATFWAVLTEPSRSRHVDRLRSRLSGERNQ